MRLKVNISRFGHEASKQMTSEVVRFVEGKAAIVKPGRSFKEVAQSSGVFNGGDLEINPVMEVLPMEEVMEELRRSFVAFLHAPIEAKKVQFRIYMEGWKGLKVVTMGFNLNS